MDVANFRTVVGVVENKVFEAKNKNECAYVDVAFEKFIDDSNSQKKYSYSKINFREFFCDSNQVFLTSQAGSVINKYGEGKLIQLKVSLSPNQENKCKYTVYYENISDIHSEDIIEVIQSELPDPNFPVVTLSSRPTTKYVMFETNVYIVSSENNFPFCKGYYSEFSSLEEAKAKLEISLKAYRDGEQVSGDDEDTECSSESELFNNFKEHFIETNTDRYIEQFPERSDTDTERNQVTNFVLSLDKALPDDANNLLVNCILARINKNLVKLQNAEDDSNVESFDEELQRLIDKIEVKKVFVGPFLITTPKTLDDGMYEFTISIPTSAASSFKTKDPENATTRRFEYSALEEFVQQVNVAGLQRKYIVQMKNWQNNGEKLDYIDNKKLVEKYCLPILNPVFKDLKPNQMSHFNTNARANKLLQKNEKRVQRALHVIETVCNFDVARQKFFNLLAVTPECSRFIATYMAEHSQDMLAKYQREMIADVKNQHEALVREKNELEGKLASIRKEYKNLENNIKNFSEKNSKTESVVLAKTVPSAEHEVLKSEHKKLIHECDDLKIEVDRLNRTRDNIHKELRTEVSDLSTRYLDMHSMLKAFTSSPKSNNASLSFVSAPVSKVSLDNISKSRNRYIEELSRVLKGMGRNIDRSKLISMMITIAQNQFTVLAGLPGSGKTSFVKCMGKALNLGNRMHKVPVARGWTSQRDILGYWNSLAGMFQAAPTGLWEMLNTLDGEKSPEQVTPALLLLDEMNLSSPEHYFSSFMDLADGESERTIFTGSPEKSYLRVPDYLHFIGTVNSDDTVNILSPRMLDRSAVILFEEKPSQAEDFKSKRSIQEPMLTYSAKDWMTLFNPDDTPDNAAYNVLTEIEELLYDDNHDLGQRIVISYRKHQQIINFLSVAIPMLSNTESALDFATKQFVLPMINGMGEGFGNRLEKLESILATANLDDSANILQRIIAEGSDRMNSYQFLA